MKETIVYIGYNLPDKNPAGVRVFANAKALKEYGYDVKLISKDDEPVLADKEYDGMAVWHVNRPKSKKGWLKNLVQAEQYTMIIGNIENVKVVIAYELPAISFLKLKKYCHQKQIKLICEVVEWQKWENLGYLNPLGRLIRVIDINLAIRYAYKKSDALIVTSRYFSDYFKDVVPTLVLPTLQFIRTEFSDLIKKNIVRKFIYAGGIGFHKDLLCEIVHAFGELQQRQFEFNILGLTLEQYLNRFPQDEELLKKVNSTKTRIMFWGRVPHTEVLDFVRQSDFAVIIREKSRRNNVGFPTKYGESINCGTPVIVSDFSDVAYYTRNFGVGIVTSIGGLTKGLEDALDMDDISLMDMQRRCRECNAFHYKGHIDEIGQFIEGLAKRL